MTVEADAQASRLSEEDILRARFYGLLSRLLMAKPDEALLDVLRGLHGDETEVGMAFGAIGEVARSGSLSDFDDEFGDLFHGYGAGGELIPNASFYQTGFVYDKPLTRLRSTLSELGIKRISEFKEPEDSMSFLLEVMYGLITGSYGFEADLAQQKQFFEQHIASWGFRFFEDLEQAETAHFYRPVGTLGRVFLQIEKDAFEMA